MYTPSLLKWGCIDFKDSFVPTNMRFQVFCLAGNIPWEKLLNVSTWWAGLRRDNKEKSVLHFLPCMYSRCKLFEDIRSMFSELH